MPAWMASAVPSSRLGKNRLVDGMNEEKLPPPSPAKNESSNNTQYGTLGSCTAKNQPTSGTSRDSVDRLTTWRVPTIGVRNMCTRRRVPPARPGIAVSQNSWLGVNV
jgi:hypothetical protein